VVFNCVGNIFICATVRKAVEQVPGKKVKNCAVNRDYQI
jgi:hypothetical protein